MASGHAKPKNRHSVGAAAGLRAASASQRAAGLRSAGLRSAGLRAASPSPRRSQSAPRARSGSAPRPASARRLRAPDEETLGRLYHQAVQRQRARGAAQRAAAAAGDRHAERRNSLPRGKPKGFEAEVMDVVYVRLSVFHNNVETTDMLKGCLTK